MRVSELCNRRVFIAAMIVVMGGMGCGGSAGSADSSLVGLWSGTQVGGSATVWTFAFTAASFDVKADGASVYQGDYTTDTSTTPSQINFVITASPVMAYIGKTTNAIYQINGNKLSFAGNEPGNPARPTAFTTSGNTVAFDLTKQ